MARQQEGSRPAVESDEEKLVLSALEPDQLAEAKKQPLPRRRLKTGELFILTALRVYLIFMIVVVLYQIWAAAR